MASQQAHVDAIKDAVSSLSTCTPATVVALKNLLQAETKDGAGTKLKAAARPTKANTKAKSQDGAVTKTSEGAGLSTRDRTILATHVINVTIKSLTEAAKAPVLDSPSKRQQIRQSPSRRTLRRSLSTPLSPLQSRTLNRVQTSPMVTTKTVKATTSPASELQAKCLPTVECSRIAFACLRSLKGPITPDQTDFQVETGGMTLVAKLITLGLREQAASELLLLKRRLEKNDESKADCQKTCDLLSYNELISQNSLATVAACQVQTLKLIAANKRPRDLEGAVTYLAETYTYSPINILSRLAKSSDAQVTKAARQMATLSQTLLTMVPGVSSSEDTVASEPRLSATPSATFELQSIAFRMQLKWWALAGHQGKIDDELLSPFARCVKCFLRRHGPADAACFKLLAESYDGLRKLIDAQKYQPSTAADSPLTTICYSLGSAAHVARLYDEAYQWYNRVEVILKSHQEASVRSCSVSARLLAVSMKSSRAKTDDSSLLESVTDALNGSLSGTTQDVNDLLESLLLARRSIAGVLMGNVNDKSHITQDFKVLLQRFLLKFPRFVLRWLGSPPGKDAAAKQILQFDQRRQTVMQCISQVLDALFVVIRSQILEQTASFEQVDEVLHECTRLLENVRDPTMSTAKTGQLAEYIIKISSLYFSMFGMLRKKKGQSKAEKKLALQSLNRSIEAVKDCTTAQKEKAQLSTKLEMMADICKASGRSEDAAKSLRTICTNMVEDGVLATVANALASQPPRVVWSSSDKASALSRTLRSMAKLDNSLNDWTFFLPEAERAAVLEHLLHITTEDSEAKPLQLHDTKMSALLRIFTPERYPIRRFRILLLLLSQNIGHEQSSRDALTLLEQAGRYLQKKDVAEDSALLRYAPHLRNQHASLVAMGSYPLPVSTLKDCVASWATMMQSCNSEDDIKTTIDNPEEFLSHLLALNQLAGLKGECHLQLSILELCVSITKLCAKPSDDQVVLYQCQLATQYVEIGLFAKASKVLEDTKQLLQQSQEASLKATLSLHLSQAGYLAGIDQTSEAMALLLKANDVHTQPSKLWSSSRAQTTLLRSRAALIQSDVALRKGDIEDALLHVRSSVRTLSYEWQELEGPSMSAPAKTEPTLIESVLGKAPTSSSSVATLGSRLWIWAEPLMRHILHISSVYAHLGLFQETWYFAGCAIRVAEGTQSPLYIATASTWLGLVCVKSGKVEEALGHLATASANLPSEVCAARIQLASRLGELYHDLEETEKAEEHFKIAEQTSQLLRTFGQPVISESTARPASKASTQSRGKALTTRTTTTRTTTTRMTTTRTTRAKAAATTTTTVTTVQKRSAPARGKPSPLNAAPSVPTDIYQASLWASVILSRAVGYMHQQDWTSVTANLDMAKDLPKLSPVSRLEKLIIATKHIALSMDEMIRDPVFSVMQDSTISFPAICGGAEKSPGRASLGQSPPRKGKAQADRKAIMERGVPAFAGALKQAQEVLLEAQASALANGDNATLHRISTLLQSTVVSLTAASSSKDKAMIRSDLTTVAVELARNATWKRESQTLQLKLLGDASDASDSSQLSSTMPLTEKMSGLSLTAGMAGFQKEFIELVPKKWNVISLSLSQGRHDLCITKFQAGHSPFILRLPLERANSRDADSEVFNFEQGREELLDIIKLANETSHSAKDTTAKAGRRAWWDKREELDVRLKDLLAMIETTWLGGFKGIFSQHQRRSDLLARFQKSFHQILDRNLPSRTRAPRGKSAAKLPAINLDPRILDLFIGLGDPTEPDSDFDEALNDLLYFVVDILQFHGERNAYDEIDFDAMVVETYDALRGYYQAVNQPGEQAEDGAHTILVLDKALHAFPWESMPCLQGLAVSRVPSLACLRRLLLEAKGSAASTEEQPAGHYVSSRNGTYILNPSSDLKNTQNYFEKPFTGLESWTAHINRVPEEEVIEKALVDSDVMLYFGHGGGAQYIRAKTIRRLERCRPATFLMGCSSAALTEAGEFECYGQVWNYMMAGCPAVVGTLWDVTDRDIDRFAGCAFEQWGLFPQGTFKEEELRKGKTKESHEVSLPLDEANKGPRSIVEAVATARNVCRFKYLNAAAVVVYGIPVYVETDV